MQHTSATSAARDLSIIIRGCADAQYGCACLKPHFEAFVALVDQLYKFIEDQDVHKCTIASLHAIQPIHHQHYELTRMRALLLIALYYEEEVSAYFLKQDPSLQSTIDSLKKYTLPKAVDWFVAGNAQHARHFCNIAVLLHEMWSEQVPNDAFRCEKTSYDVNTTHA